MGIQNVDDLVEKQIENMLSELPEIETSLSDKKAELERQLKNDPLMTEEYLARLQNPGQHGYGLIQIKGLNGKKYPYVERNFNIYKINPEQ